MFSIIGSIFGKLLSQDKTNIDGINQSGKNNTAIQIKVDGQETAKSFLREMNEMKQGDLKSTRGNVIRQENESIIMELKKDILINHEKMSLLELINKAASVANLKNDDKAIEWLKLELYGYPEDPKKIPEYRRIKVRLDVGLSFHGSNEFLDLRKDPLPMLFSSGLAQFSEAIERGPQNYRFSFAAPMIPTFTEALKKSGLPIGGKNFDINKTPYFIDSTEINSLIAALRHEIISYISRV